MSDMKAGRELNALVAEKVMGYQWHKLNSRRSEMRSPDGDIVVIKEGLKTSYTGYLKPVLPAFSTDIATAWQVVDVLVKRFRRIEVHVLPDCACCLVEAGTDETDEHYIATADADTAPLAICRAALKAVEATQ